MTRSGRARRFTGRLVPEFLVIVLGVWMALWAEGWVADPDDRAVETARLVALAQNIERTLAALRSEQVDVAGSMETLRELVLLPEGVHDGTEMRARLLSGFFFVPSFSPELNVYDDLKNSGELALLTSARLRQALSSMEASLERVSMSQEDMETVQQLNFDPYLLIRIDLRPVLGPSLDLPELAGVPGSDFDFVATMEFRNLALFKLDLLVQVHESLVQAEEELSLVAHLIREELREQPGRDSMPG